MELVPEDVGRLVRGPDFDQLSAAIRHCKADDDVLSDIASRYSMEVIGPVPQGYL